MEEVTVKIQDEVLQPEGMALVIEEVEKQHLQNVILDFTKVHYISSGALGKLLKLKQHLAAASGTLKLKGIEPDLWDIFRLIKLDKIFERVD